MKHIDTNPPTGGSEDLSTVLLNHLGAFHAFARRRLGDEQLAADAVQESLPKALKAEPNLSDRENLLAWFYRILRNVLTDLHRRKAAGDRAMSAYATDFEAASEGEKTEICGCLHALLPAMEPSYADLIRRHEFQGVSQSDLAQELGITPNNLKVRLHRARRQLRSLLEKTCTVCASHGCLDCTCEPQT
jgi:RNA polymerase sigma-70 factor (ECF subfamily)